MIKLVYHFAKYPPFKIRNFSIIAHIDHGKSTLADRFLQITNTIQKGSHSQYLDKLKVQKSRGITVKAQSVSMIYNFQNQQYLLNLVDTPGHVDFSYEVKRSMRSCQGAILLIDASQGVQAQTLSNYQFAKQQNLKIIPVINKIDIQTANIKVIIEQLQRTFNFKQQQIYLVSAKTGKNVLKLLNIIIQNIPPPPQFDSKQLKLFLINSQYLNGKGVVCLVQVKSGTLKKGISIKSCHTNKIYSLFEIGILNPQIKQQSQLTQGQIGYFMSNMKQVSQARIGDTFFKLGQSVQPQPGFSPAKPTIFASIYPLQGGKFVNLQKAIKKLSLTDPAVSIVRQSSATMGSGFRCGFLGVLHLQIFTQRLQQEYNLQVMVTAPAVLYKCILKAGKKQIILQNANECPQKTQIEQILQPIVKAKIIFPSICIKQINQLVQQKRGKIIKQQQIQGRTVYEAYIPFAQVVNDVVGKIKSLTRGYGSIDYDIYKYQKADIVKLDICLMGEPVDALCFLVHTSRAFELGKKICKKLKQELPSHLFVVVIQARVGKKVIAREEVAYVKRHVTSKCYGGDYSRKRKLLQRYKQGKKKMKAFGRVNIQKDTFLNILKQ